LKVFNEFLLSKGKLSCSSGSEQKFFFFCRVFMDLNI
jgi:hypothetical protein